VDALRDWKTTALVCGSKIVREVPGVTWPVLRESLRAAEADAAGLVAVTARSVGAAAAAATAARSGCSTTLATGLRANTASTIAILCHSWPLANQFNWLNVPNADPF